MPDNNTFSDQQLNEALQQAQEAGDQKSASIISAEIQRRSLSTSEDDLLLHKRLKGGMMFQLAVRCLLVLSILFPVRP
jgi:hypothetical protein